MWPWQLWFVLAVGRATGADAFADERVALVIGHANNQNVVPDPVREAASVVDMFKGAGFDIVEANNPQQSWGLRGNRQRRLSSQPIIQRAAAILQLAPKGVFGLAPVSWTVEGLGSGYAI